MRIIGYLIYNIAIIIMTILTRCLDNSNESLTFVLLIPMFLAYLGGWLAGGNY